MTAENPKPPRRLRRRLFRGFIAVVVIALVVRIGLPFALPGVLRSWAEERGLSLTYEELRIGILSGSVELWHANLQPLAPEGEEEDVLIDPEESIAHLEYFELDARLLPLLVGDLRVRRLELDGVDVLARRTEDGHWELEQYLKSDEEETEPPEPEEDDEPAESPASPLASIEPLLGLLRALEVSALRAQHLNVRIEDPTVVPPIRTRLEVSLRLSDVGSRKRRTRLQVVAQAPGVLNSLRIDGDASVIDHHLDLETRFDMTGLQVHALAGYLEPAGLTPRAQQLALGGKLVARITNAGLALRENAEGSADLEEELDGLLLTGSVELSEIALSADLQDAFALDRAKVSLAALRTDLVHLDSIELAGLRAQMERDEGGALVVAGLELSSPAPRTVQQQPTRTPRPRNDAPSPPPIALQLDALTARDFEFKLSDRAVAPVTELVLALEALSLTDVVLDPAKPDQRLQLALSSALPGIARSVRVEGSAVPFGRRREASFELAVAGIAPDRLAPYLGPAGLESAFEDGAFHARLEAALEEAADGSHVLSAALREVELIDEPRGLELLALDGLVVEDVVLAEGETRVGTVSMPGPRARVDRDAEGRWHVLGLRTLTAEERERAALAAAVSPKRVAARPSAGAAPGAGPATVGAAPREAPEPAAASDRVDASGSADDAPAHRLVLALFQSEGGRLTLQDEFLEPSLALEVAPLTARLENLVLGGSPDDPAQAPARLSLGLAARGLADELGLSGTIASRPGPLDLDVELLLRGRGLTVEAVEPYLAAVGVESHLTGAQLDGELRASARAEGDSLAVDASLRDVRLVDGEAELAGLDALVLSELRIAPGATTIAELAIERPRTSVARDAEGALLALGLRVLPREASTQEPADAPTAPAGPQDASEDAPAEGPPARFELTALRLREATIGWADAAVEPAAATTLRASASLDDLVLGATGTPLRIEAQLAIEDVLEALTVAGEASLDPRDLRFGATVDANGLRADALIGYFPPGLAPTLVDGRMKLALEARSAAVDAGGRSAFFELSGFDYREAEAPEPFLALDSLTLDAPRLDARAGVFELARITSSGLTAAARRTGPQRFEAFGLSIEPPPPGADDAASENVEESAPAIPPGAETAPAGDASRVPGQALANSVTLGRFDLGLERFAFTDETQPGAVPLELSAHITTPGPLVILDEDPEALPPLTFAITAAAAPIVADARVDITAAPWAPDPELSVDVAVSGIRGEGLTEVLPELASALDGSELPDGTFGTKLRTSLRVRRRGPTDFNLAGGFGVEAEVTDVAFRATPEGEVLAGLDSIFLEVASVRPRSGDVHVKTLEIARPAGRVRRTAEGVHVLGLVIKLPDGAAAEGETPAEEPEPIEPVELEDVAASEAIEAAGEELDPATQPEFRLDELLVSGIDFELRDETADPPLVMPFTDLDVEVKRFTTRAFVEPKPIHFQAFLTGGEIPLPKRDESAFLGGIAGALAGAIGGGDDTFETELRPAFDEIAISGRLSLVPAPVGWTKLTVSALELPNFSGAASQAGVEIGDGVLDTDLTLRFRGAEGMRMRSDTTFGYLSLSEAPDGPISKYLKLPAPLDVVLFALRNGDGEHDITVNLELPEGQLKGSALASAAAGTVGRVIGDALAGSPFRLLGSLTDVVGLTGGEDELARTPAAELEFSPGAATLPTTDAEDLAGLVELLNSDKELVVVVEHAFGPSDLARAEVLANPSEEDCRALAARLRRKRTDLSHERDRLAAQTRARYAVGQGQRARGDTEQLRRLDREIGRAEQALDQIYELLRPGAERRRDKRTRRAALTVAELRLEAVRDRLETIGIRNAAERVDIRRPRYQIVEGDAGGRVKLTPQKRR